MAVSRTNLNPSETMNPKILYPVLALMVVSFFMGWKDKRAAQIPEVRPLTAEESEREMVEKYVSTIQEMQRAHELRQAYEAGRGAADERARRADEVNRAKLQDRKESLIQDLLRN